MLGITGPPGTGKSTIAAAIVNALDPETGVVVPMDGFHLTRAEIAGTPKVGRRGAPDTFDANAFARAVHRVSNGIQTDVALPAFDHVVGDPVPGAIIVRHAVRLVIVEGNYLLHPDQAWAAARHSSTSSGTSTPPPTSGALDSRRGTAPSDGLRKMRRDSSRSPMNATPRSSHARRPPQTRSSPSTNAHDETRASPIEVLPARSKSYTPANSSSST